MKLRVIEINALVEKIQQEHKAKYKKELLDIRNSTKVINEAKKLVEEVKKASPLLKTVIYQNFNLEWAITRVIEYRKLKPKTSQYIDTSELKNKIILAGADSNSIEDILTKLKIK